MNKAALSRISQQLLKSSAERSISFEYHGQRLWLKQQEPELPRWRKFLPRLVSVFSSNPLYFPSIEPSNALQGEAKRLKLLKTLGINVPEVVLEDSHYLVLTDVGPSLKYWLTEAKLPTEERNQVLIKAASALGELHKHNRWHGRPALRDLCWDGDKISFIDFEENPHQLLSIDQCMVRDVLIFIHGLYRYLSPTDPIIDRVIETYQKQAPSRVWRESIKTIHNMWLVYPMLIVVNGLLGKDGKQAYYALNRLRRIENHSSSKLPWIMLSLLLAYALADQFD